MENKMTRKLASIQTILKLEPIPNADNIEVATILGWKCVVEKVFKEGDKVLYCEVDSWLPVKPEYEFLRNKCYKKNENGEGFRIKTIRLKGQISQGIIFALNKEYSELDIGTDMTEIIGVKLWAPPIPACLMGMIKGSFPSFIPKTDETRVQLLQEVLTRNKMKLCYITEKIDGSSITCYIKDGVFGVCSRNLELKDGGNDSYWEVAKKLGVEEKLRKLGMNIAIQGELFGTGIQGNPLKLQDRQIRWFNAFDIDTYTYYSFEYFIQIFKDMGLETVPIVDDNYILIDDIPDLVKLATRKSLLNKDVWAEGIVIRPMIEKTDLQMSQGYGNGRLSFKVINPEYLLKEGN